MPASRPPATRKQTVEIGPPAPDGNGFVAPRPAQGPGNLSVLLAALQAMRDGDFSVRLPGDGTGTDGKIADAFNEIAAANGKISHELNRVGEAVGKRGQTRQRVRFENPRGAWVQMETSVNLLIEDLLFPTTEV